MTDRHNRAGGAIVKSKRRDASGYPSYEVITVNGVIEIIEHRKLEPIFYITDDLAVLKELGVGAGSPGNR